MDAGDAGDAGDAEDAGDAVDADLAAAVERIPFLVGRVVRAARLGGLTNRNWLVACGADRYVVRLAGAGTAAYIDRRAEEGCARSASAARVNVPVEFFDAADGLMVTRYVDGARTMSAAAFAADPGAVARAGRAFRRLHDTAEPFPVEFRLFAMIDEYRDLLAARGAALPDGYDEAQRQAGEARVALGERPAALVPSHCDPLCENFLDDGSRMWLIDYEYAGNNDPMWDLADLAVEGSFSAEMCEALLAAYVGGRPTEAQRGRMVLYQALCDLLWTLWGVIQHVDGNPAEDFWAYAVGRFERCRALMASPEFAHHIAAVRAG